MDDQSRTSSGSCRNPPVPFSLEPLPDAEIWLEPACFSPAESEQCWADLHRTIEWRQDTIRMFGRTLPLPRLTAWYGDPGAVYTYSHIRMVPLPWTAGLQQIKDRVEAVSQSRFNSVLLNFYRDGKDSMGWHSDDEPELGINPVIASVSFGGSRWFKLRHKTRPDCQTKLELTNGSLLVMAGPTQHHWQHQIPRQAQAQPRLNLTFRWVHGG
jgi:alkylated DNA repair dioxygenase AlkB